MSCGHGGTCLAHLVSSPSGWALLCVHTACAQHTLGTIPDEPRQDQKHKALTPDPMTWCAASLLVGSAPVAAPAELSDLQDPEGVAQTTVALLSQRAPERNLQQFLDAKIAGALC